MASPLPPFNDSRMREYLDAGTARHGPNGIEAVASAVVMLLSLSLVIQKGMRTFPNPDDDVQKALLEHMGSLHEGLKLVIDQYPGIHEKKDGEKSPFQLASAFFIQDLESQKA